MEPVGLSEGKRERVAGLLRNLAHALVAHDPDAATLDGLAAGLDRMLSQVTDATCRNRSASVTDLGTVIRGLADTDLAAVLRDRPISGPGNPTAAEVAFRRDGDEIVADVRFGPAFEGAPGRVHGGMVAAVFDDVSGGVLALAGLPAYTGRLAIDYLAPVPVDVPVEFRTRLDRRTSRKLYAVAEARHAGRLLARAEALFVVVNPEQFGGAPAAPADPLGRPPAGPRPLQHVEPPGGPPAA
jgi:acyl-coenzyme A thioesterase PaaI-like protein